MKRFAPIIVLVFAAISILLFLKFGIGNNIKSTGEKFAGSESCRECHERFYQLWEPSHHGKAMQLMDSSVIATLTPHAKAIQVGDFLYKVNFKADSVIYNEYNLDGSLHRKLPVAWVLGGKNVYYFLTPWDKGRLQTLPLAYDLNRKEWYDNPQSGIRDFIEPEMQDSAISWTHSLYTFNTTCHSCHVSQLEKNYNETTGEYHTIWNEPGINCETCHGPSQEHVDVCRTAARKGKEPEDLKIIITSTFTSDQHNSSCSSCHAKMVPLTKKYPPGETFYDHFNLVTLESSDYYPDGRDLGENYTYTTWIQSECVINTDMHCVTCHTSSGRYRFKGEQANNACMPCHTNEVNNFQEHTHHKPNGDVECVSCHMPKTEFARMIRSDHSMRPPMPAASMAFGSPNACNICHDDKSPEWANKFVREWHEKDYQKETLYYGGLIHEARQHKYDRSDEMVKMIVEHQPNDLFVASMIRLLSSVNPKDFEQALYTAIESNSPLVRSAAAEALGNYVNAKSAQALLKAAQDSLRAVRVNAGSSLANMPEDLYPQSLSPIRDSALTEYKTSLITYPDNWSAHYNLGNFLARLGELEKAILSFEKASELETENVGPLVNASLIHTRLNDKSAAEEKLKKALEIDPANTAANINYGLLMGELGRFEEAKKAYLKALSVDKRLETAAYNLAIIYGQENDLDKAVDYAAKAAEINQDHPKYMYTYAFYLNSSKNNKEAAKVLEKVIDKFPMHYDSYNLLEQIYLRNNNPKGAIKIFEKAIRSNEVPESDKEAMKVHLQQLKEAFK